MNTTRKITQNSVWNMYETYNECSEGRFSQVVGCAMPQDQFRTTTLVHSEYISQKKPNEHNQNGSTKKNLDLTVFMFLFWRWMGRVGMTDSEKQKPQSKKNNGAKIKNKYMLKYSSKIIENVKLVCQLDQNKV